MQRYVAQRILLVVPTMLGISLIVFSALRFLPGDVVTQIIGDYGSVSPEYRHKLQERYGLDHNLPAQYFSWLADLAHGDIGTSIISGRSVGGELRNRVPTTLELGLLGMLSGLVIAFPIGILSAVRQDSWIDLLGRSFAVVLLSVPSFWIALLAITYGFVWFHWTPPLEYHDLWQHPGLNLRSVWVPALILGGSLAGGNMRFIRASLLDVLRQDYVRTARAKGLQERAVVLRHALRNALIPVVTVIGLQVSLIVGGTVILEQIFSLPGMASYLLEAISQRDYPVVQGIVLLTSTVVVLSNLVVDVSYALLDPRIRANR